MSSEENIGYLTDRTIHVSPTSEFRDYVSKNKVLRDIQDSLDNGNGLALTDLKKVYANLHKGDVELSSDELDKALDNMMKNGEKFAEIENKGPYIHEMLSGSSLLLPKNSIIPRNPELAARVERLRKEQDNAAYRSMTKNVTPGIFHVEDTISYQLTMMNRQLIAVGQVVLSVAAGFAFGFLGIPLIIGGLDFGVRVLLGMLAAGVIAVAELYFLSKHLSKEDEHLDAQLKKPATLGPTASEEASLKKKS